MRSKPSLLMAVDANWRQSVSGALISVDLSYLTTIQYAFPSHSRFTLTFLACWCCRKTVSEIWYAGVQDLASRISPDVRLPLNIIERRHLNANNRARYGFAFGWLANEVQIISTKATKKGVRASSSMMNPIGWGLGIVGLLKNVRSSSPIECSSRPRCSGKLCTLSGNWNTVLRFCCFCSAAAQSQFRYSAEFKRAPQVTPHSSDLGSARQHNSSIKRQTQIIVGRVLFSSGRDACWVCGVPLKLCDRNASHFPFRFPFAIYITNSYSYRVRSAVHRAPKRPSLPFGLMALYSHWFTLAVPRQLINNSA